MLGLAAVAISLVGFLKIKSLEGKTAGAEGQGMKLLGIAIALGGWFVTVAGLHITTSNGGRLVFALAGIAITLVGSPWRIANCVQEHGRKSRASSLVEPKPLWSTHDEKNPSI